MGKKVGQLTGQPLYPYLLIVFYLVYKLSLAVYAFDLIVAVLYLLIFFGLTAGLAFLSKKVLRVRYWAPFVFVCWIGFFFYSYIADLLQSTF